MTTTPAVRPSDEHEQEAATLAATLPPMPVEIHAVGAAMALNAAKDSANLGLFLLQFSARDQAAVWNALGTAQTNLNAAIEHYRAFTEILECKGRG